MLAHVGEQADVEAAERMDLERDAGLDRRSSCSGGGLPTISCDDLARAAARAQLDDRAVELRRSRRSPRRAACRAAPGRRRRRRARRSPSTSHANPGQPVAGAVDDPIRVRRRRAGRARVRHASALLDAPADQRAVDLRECRRRASPNTRSAAFSGSAIARPISSPLGSSSRTCSPAAGNTSAGVREVSRSRPPLAMKLTAESGQGE